MSVSYRPGPVAAFVGDDLVVLCADTALVATLAGAAPHSVLGVVAALGGGDLAALPDFCCLLREEDGLRIVVRGAYVVDTGSEEWGGQGIATWTERLLPRDAGVRLAAADLTGELLPVGAGSVVLAGEVVWGELPAPDAEPVLASPAVQQPEPEPAPAPVEAAPVAPAPVAPAPVTAAPADPAATRLEDEDDFDAMFGATVLGRRPEDAAVREHVVEQSHAPVIQPPPGSIPPPPPGSGPPTPVEDHDGRTVIASDLHRLRTPTPPAPPSPPTPVRPAAAVRLSTGERFTLDRSLLLGRAPRSTPGASAQVPVIHVVADPYVSSTHLQLGVEAGSIMATDLSTNGTMLERPGRSPERLPRNVPTVVRPGDVLRLSDDVTATLEEPS